MSTIDIIILACFLPALYFGIKNGLVKQLISLCVVFFGIKLSILFSQPVAVWLTEKVGITEVWSKSASFLVIFLAVAVVLSLVGRLIEKIIKISLLEWLNKLLGVVLSIAICGLVVAIAIHLVDRANDVMHFISDDKLAESKLWPVILQVTGDLFSKF